MSEKTHATDAPRPGIAAALAAAAIAFLLLIPTAHGQSGSVVWASPTRADQSRYTVTTGARLTFGLTASTSISAASVQITSVRGLPLGAEVSSSVGKVAHATFRWVPLKGGDYTIQFAASNDQGASAPKRTYTIHVNAKAYALTDQKIGKWAVVLKPAVVRAQPKLAAHAVTTLETTTTDETQNVVLVLDGIDVSPRETWYRVRLPILPNNVTGWVPSTALGQLYTVHTHLYIDRAKLKATLKRDGQTVFTAIIGIGKTYWPTPRGEFYVRTKLTNFGGGFYGPVAFGTSARSAVLTDWPGGGFVGIHGTSLPELLPGQVSHGCVRMRNEDILRLARLMQVGTPLTIL
jgi:lipoprotein-anchoring transpeptidase ErfK/SrfK